MNRQRFSWARRAAPGPSIGRDPPAKDVPWLSALKLNPRVKTMAVGYLDVGVFGLVAVVARWGFAVSSSGAVVAGMVAAAPIIIAFGGERIIGIKAFSVEISLAQITVPVMADLTQVVMQAAASQEEMLWLGMIDPATARERLSEQFPLYEKYYRAVRSEVFATQGVNAIPDRDNEIGQIFIGWAGMFSWQDGQAKQIVTSDLLRHWLGADLDTEALPYGPLIPLLQYQVNQRPHRYTALAADGRLKAVIDKSELATRTTDALLRRKLS